MSTQGFTLFDTAIGRCGIAWGPRGIVGVQLPEVTTTATRSRMARRFPEAALAPPPREVRGIIAGIVALLSGEKPDLESAPLDMHDVPDFDRVVYDVTRRIEPGFTLTYGEVATRAGAPDAARAVGQALGRNPFPIIVPCHRVLAAGGKPGGFSASGGALTKLRLLEIEGACPTGTLPLPLG